MLNVYEETKAKKVKATPVVKSIDFDLRFVAGDKGRRVDAVDPKTGATIAKLISFRNDGRLRSYGSIPAGLGLDLDSTGHMRTVLKGGV